MDANMILLFEIAKELALDMEAVKGLMEQQTKALGDITNIIKAHEVRTAILERQHPNYGAPGNN